MTEPNVDLPAPNILGGPLPLSSGRLVWLTAGEESMTLSQPEPEPAGQFIKPQLPTEDGVAAPGFLIQAVSFG